MKHRLNGRWYLTSCDQLEEFLKDIGCTPEECRRWHSLLSVTGENGVNVEYVVDTDVRAIRQCTYVDDQLVREFTVPLDVDSTGWSFNGNFMATKIVIAGQRRVLGNERGSGYFLTIDAEVTGDDILTSKWNTGNVTCTMMFTRKIPPHLSSS